MDINCLVESLGALPFHQAVWLFPFATALHFLEEAPHFADWASKYTLPIYNHQRWRRIHGLGMVLAIAFCALASIFPNRYVVFLFFALCLSESVLNSLFHVGATAFSGVYCPGLITALLVYPPLYWYLSQLAYRDGLVDQYARSYGILDRCGNSHSGRGHERVRRDAPHTSPHDVMLGRFPWSGARWSSAQPITPGQNAKIGPRWIRQHRDEL